jgi:hypothetical protein
MAVPKPQPVKMFQVKEKLLRPALTSTFQCTIPTTGIGEVDQYHDTELLSLSCYETSLPGSSLFTNEVTDDFTGVTEKFAYRKAYDQTIDLNFYVDHRDSQGYKIILFFESWIRYITNDNNSDLRRGFSYRVKYPNGTTLKNRDGYRKNIYLTKFERDFRGNVLEYTFINSYPIGMSSMPVSYQNSDILRCRVSFNYDRYVVNVGQQSIEPEPKPAIPNGLPNPGFPSEIPPTYGDPQLGLDQNSKSGQTIIESPLYNKSAGSGALF